jgi:hypothetical protein
MCLALVGWLGGWLDGVSAENNDCYDNAAAPAQFAHLVHAICRE